MVFRRSLSALVAVAGLCSAAEPESALRERVKAAFLYKFAAYVEWPKEALPASDSPITIGVVDSERIARELDLAVVGRQVGGRGLKVRRLGPEDLPLDCCQIVFIGAGRGGRAHAEQVLAALQGRPVLTVTDEAVGSPAGTIISFNITEEKVRFDISREAAEQNGLVLRAQLLAVARQVIAR